MIINFNEQEKNEIKNFLKIFFGLMEWSIHMVTIKEKSLLILI